MRHTKPLSGFLDYMPKRMSSREQIIEIVKNTYYLFGFQLQSSPCLERTDLLIGNIGEDEKLIYKFLDQGNRSVALRYDLTVPLKRTILAYMDQIALPYKRAQLGPAWRADSPGKGRFREFLQFDADIVGDDSVFSDAEVLLVVATIMQKLKVPVSIRFNNREILNSLVATCGLIPEQGKQLLRILDKLDKIGKVNVISLINQANFSAEATEIIVKYLNITENSQNNLATLRDIDLLLPKRNGMSTGTERLYKILEILDRYATPRCKWVIDPTIARGLDYYTGLVFETNFELDPSFGSVCSGGRYNYLIQTSDGKFLPTVGIGLGIDRLFAAMESSDILPEPINGPRVMIAQLDEKYLPNYLGFANNLRLGQISSIIYPKATKLTKQLQYANRLGCQLCLIVGENEIKSGTVILKNMITGQQDSIPQQDLVAKVYNLQSQGGEKYGQP